MNMNNQCQWWMSDVWIWMMNINEIWKHESMIFECNMNLNITMNLILLEVEYDMTQIVNGLQTIAMVQS